MTASDSENLDQKFEIGKGRNVSKLTQVFVLVSQKLYKYVKKANTRCFIGGFFYITLC